MSSRADASTADSAAAYVYSKLKISPESVRVHASYSGAVGSYAYVKQYYKGIPISNAVANVAFNKNKKVTSFGSSFVTPCELQAFERSHMDSLTCYSSSYGCLCHTLRPRPTSNL